MASNGASLLPNFLVPEGVQRADGESDAFDLGDLKGGLLLLTLGITRIIEQESLDVSIWGSADGANWGEKPLAAFPQKFYCGTYTIVLDLSKHPEAGFLKAKWKIARWGRGDPKPLFGFYLYAERVSGEVGVPAGGSG